MVFGRQAPPPRGAWGPAGWRMSSRERVDGATASVDRVSILDVVRSFAARIDGAFAAPPPAVVVRTSDRFPTDDDERVDAWSSVNALDQWGLDPWEAGFRIPREAADLLYERTWLSIVADLIPELGTARGFTIPAFDGPTSAALQSDLEDLRLARSVKMAWRFARQHGGGAVVKMIDDGRPSHQPVDRANIRKVVALQPLDRHELRITEWGSDGTKLGPLEYTDANGNRWHPSRVVPFVNRELAMRRRDWYEYWSISEYERIYDAWWRDEESQRALGKLVKEYSYDVLHLRDLDSKDPAEVKKTLKAIALGIKAIGRFALGSDDKYTTQSKSLAGLADSVGILIDRLAMITRIPSSVLNFKQPGGLNSGENAGDWQALFSVVASDQADLYVPAIADIVADVIASRAGPLAGAAPPLRWKVVPNDIGDLAPDRAAEVRKTEAEARAVDVAAGVITNDEARTEVVELYGLKVDQPAPDVLAPDVLEPAAPVDAPAAAPVEDSVLNGAQVAAVVDVAVRVRAGELDRASALGILRIAFPRTSPAALEAAIPAEVAPAAAPAVAGDDDPVDDLDALAPTPGVPPAGAALVGPRELNARYGIGRKALRNLISEGKIQAWKPGGRWRFLESEVAQAIAHNIDPKDETP